MTSGALVAVFVCETGILFFHVLAPFLEISAPVSSRPIQEFTCRKVLFFGSPYSTLRSNSPTLHVFLLLSSEVALAVQLGSDLISPFLVTGSCFCSQALKTK